LFNESISPKGRYAEGQKKFGLGCGQKEKVAQFAITPTAAAHPLEKTSNRRRITYLYHTI
jgi:hypothetical protein